MKKNFVIGSLVMASVMQAAVPAFAGQKEREIIGGIIGGVIGGTAGSQIGKGNGNKAATIIGAIAGALIGSKLGRDLDTGDRRGMEDAQRRGLGGRLGQRHDWDGRNYGSRSGGRGSFTSVREGYNNRTGEYCREYVNVIYLRNSTEETRGVACTRRDGSWYEVRTTEVTFGGQPGRNPGHPGQPGPRPPHHGGYNPGPSYPPGPNYPTPPAPPSYGQGRYDGSVNVYQVTRRTGGEWIRVEFANSVALRTLQVRALAAGARIHEGTLYFESGRTERLSELSPSRTFYAGDMVSAQVWNRDRVRAIDLRIESMGGYADLTIRALSDDDYPRMRTSRY